jgi:integrase
LGALNSTLRKKDLRLLTKANVDDHTQSLRGIQQKTQNAYYIPINKQMRLLIDTAPGDKIFDFTNHNARFARLVRVCGLKDFRFHDLRRTGARAMLKEGLDLATVSKWLGHRSLQTTQIYVAAQTQDMARGGEVLEKKFEMPSQFINEFPGHLKVI